MGVGDGCLSSYVGSQLMTASFGDGCGVGGMGAGEAGLDAVLMSLRMSATLEAGFGGWLAVVPTFPPGRGVGVRELSFGSLLVADGSGPALVTTGAATVLTAAAGSYTGMLAGCTKKLNGSG